MADEDGEDAGGTRMRGRCVGGDAGIGGGGGNGSGEGGGEDGMGAVGGDASFNPPVLMRLKAVCAIVQVVLHSGGICLVVMWLGTDRSVAVNSASGRFDRYSSRNAYHRRPVTGPGPGPGTGPVPVLTGTTTTGTGTGARCRYRHREPVMVPYLN